MTAKVIIHPKTLGDIEIACFLRETHNSSANLTDSPIEDGSSIFDHMFMKPKQLSLEIANDNPLNTFGRLVELQKSREPFAVKVIDNVNFYENMQITDIAWDIDKDTAKVIRATLELKEVIIVGTQAKPQATLGQNSRDFEMRRRLAPIVVVGDSSTVQVSKEDEIEIMKHIIV